MLSKSRKRAVRRWRSYCTWMRRLRGDWNMHGWKQDPIPMYSWETGKMEFCGWRNSLCGCFDLTNKQALRFKDTPNERSFDRKDWDKYRNGRGERIPIQERRAVPVEREYWSKRKRNGGVFWDRVRCGCGYFLFFKRRYMGRQNRLSESSWPMARLKLHCPDCTRRFDESKNIIRV